MPPALPPAVVLLLAMLASSGTSVLRNVDVISRASVMFDELIVVPPRHGRYGDVSTEVFSIFRAFTPLVEGMSLDEAFLDVGGLRLHFESPVAVGDAVGDRLSDVRLASHTGEPAPLLRPGEDRATLLVFYRGFW